MRMSRRIKDKALALLAAEQGTVRKDWGGRVSIALVYPNTYAVGMSNLGFQTIYRHLNALPDVVCERVFFPEPADIDEMRRTSTPPLSLESQRPLTDFQLIGFSVTYEGDYVNVLRLLDMAGLDIYQAVGSYLNQDLSTSGEVSATIRDLIEKGRLGMKTGGGIYDYTPEQIDELGAKRAGKLVAVRKALEA